MKIEIITVGDEILIGQIIDTNSAWMAAELTREGFEIVAITTVGDQAQNIIRALDTAFSRADVLLMTGGIGPTKDDITKKTLCNYFNTDLIFDESVFQNINRLFAHKNYKLNELTKNQAFVPKDCTVIQNKAGTAPLLWFEQKGKILVSMPGVPFEMKVAITGEIIPRLRKQFLSIDYLKSSFLVSGITESALAILLEDFEAKLPGNFSLAYLPSYGLIRLRLSAWGKENLPEMEFQEGRLRETLHEVLVADGDQPLEALLGEALRSNNLTVSTAESCTGGSIAHRITLVPGASAYYKGSVVSYDNTVKTSMLDVDSKSIETYGAVSWEVVEQMAQNVSEKLKTDCSIAVSGIAGPDGGTLEKPVGTVWICTRMHNETVTQKYQFGTSREENINRTTNMAILQMIKMLKKYKKPF
ncbi:MAG TPA: CinA family nicotinamide mononucleotide deamidase-related protein [Petrimonas sp.]|uniref:CinA family nicotinamide mononucleotide deamidase-related protein n=1 Tax=Petrimonas sp. TaxID=2023866 RepID=UPI0017672FAF|nr:CinA family nicotinamide mononucleotide deamidase-related protein [Petrimonas sp.]